MITNREYTFYENKCENVYIGSNSWLMDYYEQQQTFCPYLPIYQNIPKLKPLSWWQCWETAILGLYAMLLIAFWMWADNIGSISFYTGGSF